MNSGVFFTQIAVVLLAIAQIAHRAEGFDDPENCDQFVIRHPGGATLLRHSGPAKTCA